MKFQVTNHGDGGKTLSREIAPDVNVHYDIVQCESGFVFEQWIDGTPGTERSVSFSTEAEAIAQAGRYDASVTFVNHPFLGWVASSGCDIQGEL